MFFIYLIYKKLTDWSQRGCYKAVYKYATSGSRSQFNAILRQFSPYCDQIWPSERVITPGQLNNFTCSCHLCFLSSTTIDSLVATTQNGRLSRSCAIFFGSYKCIGNPTLRSFWQFRYFIAYTLHWCIIKMAVNDIYCYFLSGSAAFCTLQFPQANGMRSLMSGVAPNSYYDDP